MAAILRSLIACAAFMLLLLIARAPLPADASCTAFIDTRGGKLKYHVRQRVATELNGYLHTGRANLDQDVIYDWDWEPKSGGAWVESDPNHSGRAYFHGGYLAQTYNITLRATAPGLSDCTSAPLTIVVDPDFTQYFQIALAQSFASPNGLASSAKAPIGAATVEFTQLTLPLYMGFQATQNLFPGAVSTSNVEAEFGVKLLDPRLYVAVSDRTYSESDLSTINGWGAGVVKLPDLDRRFSVSGNLFYYPSFGAVYGRKLFSYGVAADALLSDYRIFAQLGVQRDQAADPLNSALRRTTPYLSVGMRL